MNRLLLFLGALAMAVAGPAIAQHQHHGHHMPAPKKPAAKKPAKKPAAKKPAAKKSAAKKPATKKPPTRKQAAKKAAPGKAAAAKPVRKTAPENREAPRPEPHPHAGHQMPVVEPDPHAAHRDTPKLDPPLAPPPAEAFAGPENAADLRWDPRAMEQSRRTMRRDHGGLPAYRLLLDRLEARLGKGGFAFDGEAWAGGDIDKIWLKAEGDGQWGGEVEEFEAQGLWSHAIDPWFDLQTGVRLLLEPEERVSLVAGIQGLAPYWIEVDAAAFLSDRGEVSGRFEAEHDARITQSLVLQPRAEIEFALQDLPRQQLSAGLSSVLLGARLRYAQTPEFAPYVGVEYDAALGDSRRFRRAAGEEASEFRLLAGIRAWF